MRVLAVLALAVSAVHATPVSVCRDATYEIPASRGAICSGAGASPAGKACPLKGDTAAASCHPYLPSYNGKACVAKEDAVCDLVNGNTWGCVFPSAGCPTAVKKPATPPPVTLAPTLKPPLVVTFEAKCPNWDYVGDDIVMPDIFELEPASNPALADIFKTESVSWYTEEIPPSELTKCNDKPTPRPTTAAPTTAPPPTTPAPTATTPRPVVTTPAPIVTTPAPIPTTTAPPPTTPAPTTRTPPPTTTAPPPTPPPTTTPPPTPPPTTTPPPTPPPTTTPPPTPPPTTTPPPTPPPTTTPPPTPPPTTTPPPTPPPTTTPPPTPPVTTPCVITDPPTTAPPPTTTAPPPPPPTPTTTGPITYYPTGFPSLSPSTPTPPVPFFPTGVPAVAPTNGVSAENAREEHVPASAPTPTPARPSSTPPRAGSLAGVQPQTVSLMSEAGVPSSKADTGTSPVVMVAVVAVVAVVVGGLFAAAQAKQRQRRGRTMSEDFALNMVVTPQ